MDSNLSLQLAEGLHFSRCIQFGKFTLTSGLSSPIYIDLRRLVSYPEVLRQVARAYVTILKDLTFDRVAGIPYAAVPIVTAIALETGWPAIYPRDPKKHGTMAIVEGEYAKGETAVVIDDLATTGGSKLEAIAKLAEAGLVVRDIVVLIDRQQGAREYLVAAGYQYYALVNLTDLLDQLLELNAISQDQYHEVLAYLKPNSKAS